MKRIQDGINKIIAGDFKARIPYIKGENSGNEYDEIIRGLNEMAAELSGVETLRTDFVSNVSHEIKTPLAVIQNYGTMLQNSALTEEKKLEYAKAITEQTKKLSDLITNILKLNRLENQQIYPNKKDLSGRYFPCDSGERFRPCSCKESDRYCRRRHQRAECTGRRNHFLCSSEGERLMEKWKKIGKALLFPCWGITIFLVIISAVMLVYAFGYENPNSVITYASYFISAYAFYCLTMAIKNMIKYRNMEQPILSAAKMLSFAFALMSILAMQTAMLTEFGNGREDFARLVN